MIIDECHVFFDENDRQLVKRWNNVIRIIRALGILIWAATQFVRINSFGNNGDLKEGLGGRTIVAGKIRDGNAKGLLRVGFDPNQLPTGGGWWFIDAEDGRSAMWRANFLDATRSPGKHDSQADRWFQTMPRLQLEQRALRGMPEFYTRRAELAEETRQRLLHRDGSDAGSVPRLQLVPSDGWQPNWPTLTLPTPPDGPSAVVPDGLTGQHARVWEAIAAGRSTATEIGAAIELGKTRVYELLGQLADAGHVRKTKGQYEVVPGA